MGDWAVRNLEQVPKRLGENENGPVVNSLDEVLPITLKGTFFLKIIPKFKNNGINELRSVGFYH